MGTMSSEGNTKTVHDSMAPSTSSFPFRGGNADCRNVLVLPPPPPSFHSNGSYSSQREALQEEVKRAVPLGDIEGSPSVGCERKQLREEDKTVAQPASPAGRSLGIRDRFFKAVSFGSDPLVREISFRTKEEAEASFLSPAEYFFIKRRAKAQAAKRRKSGYPAPAANCNVESHRDNSDSEEATRGLDMVDDELMQHRDRNRKNALAVVMENQQKDATPSPAPPLPIQSDSDGDNDGDGSEVIASKDEDVSERIAQAYREQTRQSAESAVRQAESDAKEVDSYLADARETLGIGKNKTKKSDFGRRRKKKKGSNNGGVDDSKTGGRLRLKFKFPNMLRMRTRGSSV